MKIEIIVRGPRRSGKTTIAAVLSDALVREGINPKDLAFKADTHAEAQHLEEYRKHLRGSGPFPLANPPVEGGRKIVISTEDAIQNDQYIRQFPHCDSRVLHAPKSCVYCDKYPEWQHLREAWGIAFTGKPESGKLPCPSEIRRDINTINRWPGNQPYDPAATHSSIPSPNVAVWSGVVATEIVGNATAAPTVLGLGWTGEFRDPPVTIPDRKEESSPAEVKACCDRDTDDDGNCDKHPKKVATNGVDPAYNGPAPKPINPATGQHESYWVLSPEDRAKGFIRPVRRNYKHVGAPGPKNPLRDLTEEEKSRYAGLYVKYEKYLTRPSNGSSVTGRYWTQADLDKVGKGCGSVTTMSREIAETYARNPTFYGKTFCVGCRDHLPVGDYEGEFVWEGTNERVGT